MFNILHDASHSALFSKNVWPNGDEIISRIFNSLVLWNHDMWIMHHIISHHVFTGNPDLDPDEINLKPFLRKSTYVSPKSY